MSSYSRGFHFAINRWQSIVVRYLVPGPLPCPEVVAVFYIRPAEVPTLFSVEGDAQVKQQNPIVGFLTDLRFVQRKRQTSAGAEGVTEGKQSPHASTGEAALTSPSHLSRQISGKCSLKLLEHPGPAPGQPFPANFVQVKMYDEPVVLGTMGQGFPVFCQPVHVAQTLLPSEAPLYTQQEVLILHNKYPGRAWVNQALADKEDNRLRAEVHHYWSLMDEADQKERKLSTIQNRLMDISMNLCTNM